MRNLYNYLKLLPFLILLFSCETDEELDQEKPIINMSALDAFPVACDTLFFGDTFTLQAVFEDNATLGSYNIDIHNNFDHHTHSTETAECNLADQKQATNSLVFIQDYNIPSGNNTYETNLELTLPSSNENGRFQEGDYHFHITLVDANGWSTIYGVGIKIFHKE